MKRLALVLAVVAMAGCKKAEQQPAQTPMMQDTSHMMMSDTAHPMAADTAKKMAPAAPTPAPAPKKKP
jgi:hypothetical protein